MIGSFYGFTPAFEIKINIKCCIEITDPLFSFEYDINRNKLFYAEYMFFEDKQQKVIAFKFNQDLFGKQLKKDDVVYMYNGDLIHHKLFTDSDFQKLLNSLDELKNFLILKIGV